MIKTDVYNRIGKKWELVNTLDEEVETCLKTIVRYSLLMVGTRVSRKPRLQNGHYDFTVTIPKGISHTTYDLMYVYYNVNV